MLVPPQAAPRWLRDPLPGASILPLLGFDSLVGLFLVILLQTVNLKVTYRVDKLPLLLRDRLWPANEPRSHRLMLRDTVLPEIADLRIVQVPERMLIVLDSLDHCQAAL